MIAFTIRTIAKILTYVLALLTLVAAYSGYIDPNLWATPSLLTLPYPYLALLTLIVGVIWLCMRRFIPAIVCALALIGGSASLLANLPVATTKEPRAGEKVFTIMTYNIIHGIDVRMKDAPQNRTLEYIIHSNADMVCVQELYRLKKGEIQNLTAGLLDTLRRVYPYHILDPKTDLALFSKYPARKVGDAEGHCWMKIYDLYRVNVRGTEINVLNVHLAPFMLSEKERQVVTDIHGVRSAKNSLGELKGSIMTKMKQAYRNRSIDAGVIRSVADSIKGPLIICGDFNDVPASWTYRTIRSDDLHDAYADTGLGYMYTYNMHGFYFHIDQILYRGPLRALQVEKGDINSSDHYPVTARFALLPAGR